MNETGYYKQRRNNLDTMNLFVDCHVFDGKFQGTKTYL